MNINKILLMIIIFCVFIGGIVIGAYLIKIRNGDELPDLNLIKKSCQYGGNTYKSGEGFKNKDGCNSCSCEDGQVGCTAMYCEQNSK